METTSTYWVIITTCDGMRSFAGKAAVVVVVVVVAAVVVVVVVSAGRALKLRTLLRLEPSLPLGAALSWWWWSP